MRIVKNKNQTVRVKILITKETTEEHLYYCMPLEHKKKKKAQNHINEEQILA